MSIYRESGFEFDFTSSVRSVIHDKDVPHDGNTFWPGVDFRIFETDQQVWLEVKSWSFKAILERVERRRAKQDYNRKLIEAGANAFRDDIVAKFLGTTCYLTWASLEIPDRVCYVVFLEPPDRGSRALLGPFQDRLRDQFKNAQARSWGRRIKYRVVDIALFQMEFPNYPVVRV